MVEEEKKYEKRKKELCNFVMSKASNVSIEALLVSCLLFFGM